MKYKIFKTNGHLDREFGKDELIAIEHGNDIYDVTDAIIKAIEDDLSERPEFIDCTFAVYPPEKLHYVKAKHYTYGFDGIIISRVPSNNTYIRYGVVETVDGLVHPQGVEP